MKRLFVFLQFFVCGLCFGMTFEEVMQIEDDSEMAMELTQVFDRNLRMNHEQYNQVMARIQNSDDETAIGRVTSVISNYSNQESRESLRNQFMNGTPVFQEATIQSLNFIRRDYRPFALETLKSFYRSSQNNELKGDTLRGILRNSEGQEMDIIVDAMANPEISRRKIIRAIREDGSPEHLPFIIDILRDSEDNRIRKAAIDGLDELIRRHSSGSRQEQLLACIPDMEVTPLSDAELDRQATIGVLIPVLLLGARTQNIDVPQISAEYAETLKAYFLANI